MQDSRLIHIEKCSRLLFAAVLIAMPMAQAQQKAESLSIDPYPGEMRILRSQGHAFVDLEDLARITKGSLRFEGNRIVLTLPSPSVDNDAPSAGFSRPFMKGGIEAMAALREWGGMLMVAVQHGDPVENTTVGNTIGAYQNRAADTIALASAEARNDSDRLGLDLLRNEFNGMQTWSRSYIKARRSMSAANMSMSENALNDDADAQKLIHCGQFLAQMFASGTFQDNVVCH